MRKTPVSANPGDQFEYNNVIYGLIGDIMASITGKPLETALKEYLFKPLGMDHACIGLPALLEACDRFYPYIWMIPWRMPKENWLQHRIIPTPIIFFLRLLGLMLA